MSRLLKPSFHPLLLALSALVLAGPLPAPAGTRKSIRLEDDRYLVEVSRANGAITRIRDKPGGIELIREPRLADNFRFTLPLPGKEPWQTIEANYIWGGRQKLSSCEAGATKLVLRWEQPLLNYLGEKFDASAAMTIELTSQGVLFALRIDNRTPYRIGEVFFPLIGGLQGLGRTAGQLKATQMIRPASTGGVSSNAIFRVFANMSPLGDQGPEQFYACPKDMPEPWVEFSTRGFERSVCIGAHDSQNRPAVLRLELIPGVSDTVREDGNWPRPGELRGQPVGVSLCFVDFANAPAHARYEFPPVLVAFHDGGWSEAKKIFQKWNQPK